MTGEIWMPIPGHENLYEASSFGRIRSLPRRGKKNRKLYGGDILAPCKTKRQNGTYFRVLLYRNAIRERFSVHRLVCGAFHGPCPADKKVVAHWDGNPSNNRPENLRWATHEENEADKLRHGTLRRGETATNVRLSAAQVMKIRGSYAAGGIPLDDLALKYGVKKAAIFSVISRQNWRHLGGERKKLDATDPRRRPGSTLTESQAREILASKERGVILAKRYGVTPATITNIRVGRTWSFLPRTRVNVATGHAAIVWCAT